MKSKSIYIKCTAKNGRFCGFATRETLEAATKNYLGHTFKGVDGKKIGPIVSVVQQ